MHLHVAKLLLSYSNLAFLKPDKEIESTNSKILLSLTSMMFIKDDEKDRVRESRRACMDDFVLF